MKKPGIEDVMIEPDLGGSGGRIVIRNGTGDFVKVTRENSFRCSTAEATAFQIVRDELAAIKVALLAMKKGGK